MVKYAAVAESGIIGMTNEAEPRSHVWHRKEVSRSADIIGNLAPENRVAFVGLYCEIQ